jgi:ATP-binding cassette subfamily B protein
VVPVMVVCCTRFNHMVRATFLKQRRHIGELNARIEDSLLGERVVKAFGGEDLEREKFEQDNGRFLDIKKETYRWMAAFNTTTRLFDGLMYLVVIVAGGLFMLYGKIEPGDLVAYMLYVTTLLSTIRRIIEFAEQFQRGMTGIERFCEIMDADVDIFDDENAKPLENVQGRITFEHVSFEYPDDHNKVLHDLSLDVRPGEKLALVGPSGGGKTTLCNLIPRFYDATSGHVCIDGRDVKTVTLESLRRAIGIVQQDVYLFSGTVYENILYGRPDATRAEVEQAAKLAECRENPLLQQLYKEEEVREAAWETARTAVEQTGGDLRVCEKQISSCEAEQQKAVDTAEKSAQAAESFFAAHPDYPVLLSNKIRQQADHLYR